MDCIPKYTAQYWMRQKVDVMPPETHIKEITLSSAAGTVGTGIINRLYLRGQRVKSASLYFKSIR